MVALQRVPKRGWGTDVENGGGWLSSVCAEYSRVCFFFTVLFLAFSCMSLAFDMAAVIRVRWFCVCI